MKRSFAPLSILAASISLLLAAPVCAAEVARTNLQTQTSAGKAVAGNIGSNGKAPDGRVADSRNASRDAGRARSNTMNERALNPQPLPPVERGRRGGAAGDQNVLPNGIIIVGGKNGGAR